VKRIDVSSLCQKLINHILSRKSDMLYFDANAMIGAHFGPREGKFFTATDLLEEMDFFGIDEALVYHGLAREYDFVLGNQQLMVDIAKLPRLHPCWVVGFHYGRTMPPPKALLEDALQNGVKAVRLFFGSHLSHSMVLDLVSHQELFRELEKHRFPTIVEFEDSTQLLAEHILQLDKVLEAFSSLPIILSAPKVWTELKLLYPRMAKHPQLYMEISGLHGNGVMEDLVKNFGAQRLIFGTRFPWFSGGQVKIALAYSNISPEEKEAIAGGNLSKLIRGVQR